MSLSHGTVSLMASNANLTNFPALSGSGMHVQSSVGAIQGDTPRMHCSLKQDDLCVCVTDRKWDAAYAKSGHPGDEDGPRSGPTLGCL